MKNTSLIISIAALVVSLAFGTVVLCKTCCKGGKADVAAADTLSVAGPIAYFNISRVIKEYDFANDRTAVVQTEVENIENEINRRGKKVENDYNAFQDKINKGLLTQSTAQVQGQKLQQQQAELNNYAQKKQAEIQEKLEVLNNEILDAIKTYVEKFNADGRYALILANQGTGGSETSVIDFPVVNGSAALDLTDAIIAGLNEEYVKSKNEKEE
ncbi:MAG: OmpH family outer membrane protein [Bacteroidales bacterium]|nr:OmpH family outer membrane protein [Bacteroidales bacterium]